MVCTRALIFHTSIVTRPFCGYKNSWPCDLDLGIWSTNHGSIFWMLCTRTLIFHMSVSSDKTFLWIPTDFTLWPWCLTYIRKTLTMLILFEEYVLGLWYFTWMFIVTIPCSGYQQVLTLWPWPLCLTYLLKTLTLAVSFEWYVLWLWYCTWVFLETRPPHGYQQIWPCELDLDILPIYLKFKLWLEFFNTCSMYQDLNISYDCSLWQDLSMAYKNFS
jgi:hypothetical protein